MEQGRSPHYGSKSVESMQLITYKDKIYIPTPLQQSIVTWYHEYLCHPGENRTEETIRSNFTWPNLRKHVLMFCKTCRKCQMCKKSQKKYGHLPPKTAEVTPWKRVNVDLIGPYTVRTPSDVHHLRALTIIDPVTRWFEIKDIKIPNSHTGMEAFNKAWLCRYLRHQYIGYDNGNEFKSVF